MWLTLLTIFPKIGSFALKYWRETLILLIVSGMYFYYHHMQNEIKTLTEAKQKLENQIAQCEAHVTQQNNAIDAANSKAKEQQTEMDNLQKRLNILKAKSKKEISDILNGTKPKTCEETIKYLIDGSKELTW